MELHLYSTTCLPGVKRDNFTFYTLLVRINKHGTEDELWWENVKERPVGGPRHRWEKIKSDHKERKWEIVRWIILAQNTD